jgi:hypothetical protein
MAFGLSLPYPFGRFGVVIFPGGGELTIMPAVAVAQVAVGVAEIADGKSNKIAHTKQKLYRYRHLSFK